MLEAAVEECAEKVSIQRYVTFSDTLKVITHLTLQTLVDSLTSSYMTERGFVYIHMKLCLSDSRKCNSEATGRVSQNRQGTYPIV